MDLEFLPRQSTRLALLTKPIVKMNKGYEVPI